MFIAHSRKVKFLTGACILFGAMIFQSSQAFAVCKPVLSVGGPTGHQTKPAAELLARTTWQINAGNLYGGPYAKWSKAQSKQSSCSKQNNLHVCQYTAQPCN